MGHDIVIWPAPVIIVMIVFIAGAVAALAIVLLWGMSQWGVKTPHRVGDQMANTRASVAEWSGNQGYVWADGELWRAVSGDPLRTGEEVKVTRVDGLTLEVRKKQSHR